MESKGRIDKSIKNMKYVLIGQIISIIISFTGRTIFVHILGREYLGVNGLFSNILAILSLAEMGIGSAIVCSLYKPLAEDDQNKVLGLMHLFKNVYMGIGSTILIVGCALTPFLNFFVNERPNIPYFELIYVLFVLNNACGYFFSYKGMLINADQKQYITTTITQITTLLMNVLQIICLILTHNYILFLLIMLCCTLLRNILFSRSANSIYPYLKTKYIGKLDEDETKKIKNNVKAMIMHKMGGVVVDSTDNLLLSKIVSVSVVGLYSNYYLITHTISTIYNMLFNALIASVGNLGATTEKNIVYKNFKIINFAGMWLYYFSFVCLFNLFNPFIELWIGNEYIFGMSMTLVICLNFYFTGIRNGILTFRSALGLFWYDRYKAIVEAIVNLIASIILGRIFGAIGIFIGTLISTLCICLVVEPHIVYKYAFGKSSVEYYIKYLFNFILSISVAFGIYYINNSLGNNSFIVNILLCITIPNVIYYFIFRKSIECQALKDILVRRIKKR